MKNIKFTAEFICPVERVHGFASHLGYVAEYDLIENGQVVLEEGVPIKVQNPETEEAYIARLVKLHILPFTTSWADFLVTDHINKNVKPQIEASVKKPVEDALVVVYEDIDI